MSEVSLKILILVAPCWMEVFWLPTVLNMLQDTLNLCPIIKNLSMEASVEQVLKDLPLLHLALLLLSNVCLRGRGTLPQVVRHCQGDSSIDKK